MKVQNTSLIVIAALVGLGTLAVAETVPNTCSQAADGFVPRTDLAPGALGHGSTSILRFAQISDVHLLDDDGQILNGLSPLDPVHPVVSSAQRLQDEYTDEVLNSMIGTIDACHADQAIAFMISTGDNVDLGVVNEVRRFIDTIDGVPDQMSAFEKKCRASFPAGTPEQALNANCTRFTGRALADTQTVDPDPNDPSYQLTYTRMLRQLLDTESAVITGRDENGAFRPDLQTVTRAPGLPGTLRCTPGNAGCALNGLDKLIPYYITFGNHDGTARGTVTYEPGMQDVSLVTGRHFMQFQHEFIDEFFETTNLPGPVGHGFNEAGARLGDADPRNDGYYALNAPQAPRVRLIVLNTLIDGIDGGVDLGAAPVVGPLQVRNPFALDSGAIDQEQFDWLKTELALAETNHQLVLVFSHHPDVSFAELGTFAFLVPGHVSAAALDGELASHANVVAWIAGHTHRNRIRAFRVTGSSGTNGDITAPVACTGSNCLGFWQIETASLIDAPQEARILEIFDNGDGTGVIKATLIEHSVAKSKTLAEADDRCQFYLDDPASVQRLVTEADLTAICTEGGSRSGAPGDRNVELTFRMP